MINKANKKEVALRRIAAFEKKFTKQHLYLAYHIAFPVGITIGLANKIWLKFNSDIHGIDLCATWIHVADVILSGLVHEVGYGLYEMDTEIRNELLHRLKNDSRFGEQRLMEIAEFLIDYTKDYIYSNDPDTQCFAIANHLTALAYLRPDQAKTELVRMIKEKIDTDELEVKRLQRLSVSILGKEL